MNTQTLLTVAEVAERLRCSLSGAYNHITTGRLKAYRVGSKKGYRVDEESLQAFLRARETGPELKHITLR